MIPNRKLALVIGLVAVVLFMIIGMQSQFYKDLTNSNHEEISSDKPHIDRLDIVGLEKSYKIGQPIIAEVHYAGYWRSGVWIDVRILDVNNNEIWHSSPVVHSETVSLFNGTFSYKVDSPTGYPVINQTGTYTMIASLDNKTVESKFDVFQ